MIANTVVATQSGGLEAGDVVYQEVDRQTFWNSGRFLAFIRLNFDGSNPAFKSDANSIIFCPNAIPAYNGWSTIEIFANYKMSVSGGMSYTELKISFDDYESYHLGDLVTSYSEESCPDGFTIQYFVPKNQ